jgi:hypothetical protein
MRWSFSIIMLQEKKNFVRGENNTSEMFDYLSIQSY